MKTLAALSGAGLLLLVGCGDVTTKTFVANEAIVPADDDATASQDFDGDGEVDNEINGVKTALGLAQLDLEVVLNDAIDAGTVLIAADISAKDFNNDDKNAAVTAFLAAVAPGTTPKFDGTDAITVSGETFDFNAVTIINGNVSTGQSDFVFALPLSADAPPTLLKFSNAKLSGNVAGANITGGALSGTIDSVDFAQALGEIGGLVGDLIEGASATANANVAVACVSDAANSRNSADCAVGQVCSANNAIDSGFCVPSDNGTLGALDLLDVNGSGSLDVTFNAGTKEFDENELFILFDTPGPLDTASPNGALGSLFSLDLVAKGDGVKDSMPLGLKFDGVAAVDANTKP